MKSKILFLEGDALTRILYCSLISHDEFECHFTDSIENANVLLEQENFDLVVADGQIDESDFVDFVDSLGAKNSIIVSDGKNDLHKIQSKTGSDLIIKDSAGTYLKDLGDLIEVSCIPKNKYYEAIDCLKMHLN